MIDAIYGAFEILFYVSGLAVLWELLKIHRIVRGNPDERNVTLSNLRAIWHSSADNRGRVHFVENRKADHNSSG